MTEVNTYNGFPAQQAKEAGATVVEKSDASIWEKLTAEIVAKGFGIIPKKTEVFCEVRVSTGRSRFIPLLTPLKLENDLEVRAGPGNTSGGVLKTSVLPDSAHRRDIAEKHSRAESVAAKGSYFLELKEIDADLAQTFFAAERRKLLDAQGIDLATVESVEFADRSFR